MSHSAERKMCWHRCQRKNAMNTQSNSNAGSGCSSHDLLAALESWGSIVHDDEGGFIERFCPAAWILTQVTWGSKNMRFVYILSCGQHIADSVKITEWLEFLSANADVDLPPRTSPQNKQDAYGG